MASADLSSSCATAVVQQGPFATLTAAPADPFVTAFL
jgi:hypothetical protein